MENLQEQIVNQARSWIGTPFHHQARLKGKGCDCLGLIVGVVAELELKDPKGTPLADYDEPNYSASPDGDYLIAKLCGMMQEVPKAEKRAGDLGLFTIGGNPQHLAIVSDHESGFGMIHCYAQARRVVEHRLDAQWESQLVKVFRWLP
jgi:NlpC/P60 family putative phage cell wall peptidase